MLLRRITKHVKDQNWFAVGIDFIIVVIGVGVALAAGEWVNTHAAKADLKSAETAIHAELYSNYLNALERVAVTDCNAAQIRQLVDKLKNSDDPWTPVAPIPNTGDLFGELGTVLRGPYRGAWRTEAWNAAGGAGLLIHMDPVRQGALSKVFSVSETLSQLQDEIFRKQSKLKALMIASELSAADRLRYYDILGEIDAATSLMELGAQSLIEGTEALAISLEPELEQQFLEVFESRNQRGFEAYGECFKPMVLSENRGEQ